MDEQGLFNMCLDESDSDYKLVIDTDEIQGPLEIPVHSLVLKRTSPVFKMMLEGDRFEESKTRQISLHVPGDSLAGVHFVRYLYTRKLSSLHSSLYVPLMKMAHMYEIISLIELCEERLSSILEPYSVCKVYLELEIVASRKFLDKCLRLMLRSAFLIFRDHHHVSLRESTMWALLRSNCLNVLSEDQALEALWYWGRMRCIQENKPGNINTESAVTNLLPLIRWGLIKNLDEYAPWSGLLEECKLKWPSTRERLDANEDGDTTNLNKISLKWNVFDDYEVSLKMDFRREGKYQLLLFTVKRSVLLSGLKFSVTLKNRCSWKDSLQFAIDNELVYDFAISTMKPRNHYHMEQQPFNNVYTYSVEVEFLRPFIFEPGNIHTITMCVLERCSVAYPQFSQNRPLSFRGLYNNLDFSILGKVSAITALYYF